MDINTLWTCFLSFMGACALLVISAIIWFVRLEGKVKSNEKVFDLFMQNSKEKDEKIESSINKIYDLIRKVEKVVNQMQGASSR